MITYQKPDSLLVVTLALLAVFTVLALGASSHFWQNV